MSPEYPRVDALPIAGGIHYWIHVRRRVGTRVRLDRVPERGQGEACVEASALWRGLNIAHRVRRAQADPRDLRTETDVRRPPSAP